MFGTIFNASDVDTVIALWPSNQNICENKRIHTVIHTHTYVFGIAHRFGCVNFEYLYTKNRQKKFGSFRKARDQALAHHAEARCYPPKKVNRF